MGGRIHQGNLPYNKCHLIILPHNQPLTKMITHTKYDCLSHSGPTLAAALLVRPFHTIHGQNTFRYIIHKCITCKCVTARWRLQILGRFPSNRITTGLIFDRVDINYAGPPWVNTGSRHRPTMVKACACIFAVFTVKATHIKAISDLTPVTFIVALRHLVVRRGKRSVVWSVWRHSATIH